MIKSGHEPGTHHSCAAGLAFGVLPVGPFRARRGNAINSISKMNTVKERAANIGRRGVLGRRWTQRKPGQRIDNSLIRLLKGVPKSHIYQLLRTRASTGQ